MRKSILLKSCDLQQIRLTRLFPYSNGVLAQLFHVEQFAGHGLMRERISLRGRGKEAQERESNSSP